MGEEKLEDIKKKKEQLKTELDQIQKELDRSVDEVRDDVAHNLKPSEIIKNYPIPAVGLALLAGYLVGHRPRKSSSSPSSEGSSSRGGFSSLLISELKKLATRKAVSAATDFIDQLLESKKEEITGTNDTGDEE